MSSALLLPAVLGFLASLLGERLVQPPVRGPLQRPRACLLLHAGLWCLAFAASAFLLQRPWLAAFALIALQLVVIQASNAKWHSLREPFVIHDFEYFVDAIRYPRLYVPFFGIGLAIGAFAAVTVVVATFMVIEPALFARADANRAAIGLITLALLGTALVQLGRTRLPTPSLTPADDLQALGLVGHFWAYARRARRPRPIEAETASAFTRPPAAGGAEWPDVVLVQNESFFDPRRWSGVVHPGLLPQWDSVRTEAIAHGQLQVPAWGANTARTEAAVLTGLGPEALDIDRFNPYRRLAREGVPNLARSLREIGYETVVIHPYPAGFYARDRVMKTMGFDRFIDIAAFADDERDGQFVSDRAVARRLRQLLDEPRSHPLFVFVITMENHGPAQLERADPEDPVFRDTLATPGTLPAELRELPIYLRHLANADRMLGECRQALQAGNRAGVLGWYGDHVPTLPETWQRLGPPDGCTDYAIWTTRQRDPVPEKTLSAETLGAAVLEHAIGMTSEPRESSSRTGEPQGNAGLREQA